MLLSSWLVLIRTDGHYSLKEGHYQVSFSSFVSNCISADVSKGWLEVYAHGSCKIGSKVFISHLTPQQLLFN